MFDGVDTPAPAKALLAARALLAEKGWCQRHYAVDADGDSFPPLEGAARFCAVGAIMAASPSPVRTTAWELLRQAVHAADLDYIPAWNDHPNRTKEEVLAAFDRAIALAMVPA